ncbi:helix-turn-helix domain-containing protein [Streptomyces sp. NPDC047515]|uniref:TetR/AcrR family transcriptional regulator n=1 Tax=Streptomyces sp. NPDC047515 TaxID=3155380 RepID=UPI0033EED4AB
MAMSTAQTSARPMRADARRNYDRLLGEARTAFAEHGTDASLEDIARRAGVGIGTLYRHFPNRHALMNAVFQEALTSLINRSRELAGAQQPCRGLVEWLGAIITHAGEYRGLAQALMSTSRDETSALSQCNVPLREAGAVLLERAQASGAVRSDVSIDDLMQLTNAIALTAEQSPDDPELASRLLMLTLQGLKGPNVEAN